MGLGGACAGVRTRGGLNSSRFVGGRLTSSVKQFLRDIRHYMSIHCRCSKETYLDENTLLNYRWQSSADQLPKSVSNFIKKAPIKEVTNLGTTSRIKAAVLLDFVQMQGEGGLSKCFDTLTQVHFWSIK